MSGSDMLHSTVRSEGDLAGVFEYDGETGYFYLYDLNRADRRKILGAIHVLTGSLHLDEQEIAVSWDSAEEFVGLFLGGVLWAAFDSASTSRYGGDYAPGVTPSVPSEVARRFGPAS